VRGDDKMGNETVTVSAASLDRILKRAIKFFGGYCKVVFLGEDGKYVCLTSQITVGPIKVNVSVNEEDHCQLTIGDSDPLFSDYLYNNGLDLRTLDTETFRRWVVNKTLDLLSIFREGGI